jgi:hypothetical protein
MRSRTPVPLRGEGVHRLVEDLVGALDKFKPSPRSEKDELLGAPRARSAKENRRSPPPGARRTSTNAEPGEEGGPEAKVAESAHTDGKKEPPLARGPPRARRSQARVARGRRSDAEQLYSAAERLLRRRANGRKLRPPAPPPAPTRADFTTALKTMPRPSKKKQNTAAAAHEASRSASVGRRRQAADAKTQERCSLPGDDGRSTGARGAVLGVSRPSP